MLNFEEISHDETEIITLDDQNAIQALLAPSQKSHNPKSAEKIGNAEKPHRSHQWTVETFPVPKLSKVVMETIKKGLILTNTSELVSEAGNHLIELLDGSTSCPRNFYVIFVVALLNKYPDIDSSTTTATGVEIGVRL